MFFFFTFLQGKEVENVHFTFKINSKPREFPLKQDETTVWLTIDEVLVLQKRGNVVNLVCVWMWAY